MPVILLYEKDPGLAGAVEAELFAAGHEVRRVEAFHDVPEWALAAKPAAVLFRVDRKSLGTFGAARAALDPDVPVVAMGKRRFLYRAFTRLWTLGIVSGPGRLARRRFWFVEVPFARGAAREAVDGAIGEASAPLTGAARRPGRLPPGRALAPLAGVAAVVAGIVLSLLGYLLPLLACLAAALFGFAVSRARTIVAALRTGLRPPWWSYTSLALDVLFGAAVIGVIVRLWLR